MHRLFNTPAAAPEGWYWLLRSGDVRPKRVAASEIFGHRLAVYRGDDGRIAALDAYCPHMGAHLAEGRVEGGELRCFFHNWRFDRAGNCTAIPAPRRAPPLPGCPGPGPVRGKHP